MISGKTGKAGLKPLAAAILIAVLSVALFSYFSGGESESLDSKEEIA